MGVNIAQINTLISRLREELLTDYIAVISEEGFLLYPSRPHRDLKRWLRVASRHILLGRVTEKNFRLGRSLKRIIVDFDPFKMLILRVKGENGKDLFLVALVDEDYPVGLLLQEADDLAEDLAGGG